VCHDERRHLQFLDHGRDGKGLAGAGRAEQNLIPHPFMDAVYKLSNRLRLIAGWYEGRLKVEGHEDSFLDANVRSIVLLLGLIPKLDFWLLGYSLQKADHPIRK
jgi:hypothetical protein